MDSSIIIPTYNQDVSYLRACLLSAKHQTHKCEIIIVDDGSTPNQEETVVDVLEGYSAEFNVPCMYIYQENQGVSGALNRGLEEAKGEYIQWLPSDDLFHPSKTQIQLEALKSRDAKVGYTAYQEGIPITANTWGVAEYPNQGSFFEAFKKHCFVNAATIMFHRSILDELGNFDSNMVHCQDYEFLLRMAEKYNFVATNIPLVRRRVHEGQMIQTLKDPEEKAKKDKDMEFLRDRYGVSGHVWIPS